MRSRKALVRLSAAVLLIVALACVPGVREPVLRRAGSALVAEDPIQPADVIVVPEWAYGAGVLEAADLVHAGVARRVAVIADPPDAVDQEFIRRGLPYDDLATRAIRQLRSLGVTEIEQIPQPANGTEAEGRLLAEWCDRNRYRTVVVVSTPDHSRRARRVLRRSLKGHATTILIRTTPFASFHADRWWQTRDGVRIEIQELQKLILDVARHPLS